MIRNPTYRGVVHPWQCDHMGHMNVMFYVNKFDEASWSFFTDIGMTAKRMKDEMIGLAAVQQDISYSRELMPGQTVLINTRVEELRGKVLKFTHEMMNADTHELCATCTLTVVHLDRKTRKAIPFPEDVAGKAEAAMKAKI